MQALQLALWKLLLVATSLNVLLTHQFVVPPSAPYIDELQRSWSDPKAFFHLPSDCRSLTAMQCAAAYSLEQMPVVDTSNVSLVVSLDEAVRKGPRSSCPQCRTTDNLLTKGYNIAAWMGWLGNSPFHGLGNLTVSPGFRS